MELIIVLVACLVGAGVAFLVGVVANRKKLQNTYEQAQSDSKKLLEAARAEADQIVKDALREAKDEHRKRRQVFEQEAKQKKSETLKLDQKLKTRERNLEKKLELLDKREAELEQTEDKLRDNEKRYKQQIRENERLIEKSQEDLERIANLSREEAKRELIAALEGEAQKEAQSSIRAIEEQARRDAEERSRGIISLAVQRVSGEFVNDSTVSVVALPSEEMKGRIIGREGRNIRTIEQVTGVDLIIDDTPEAVILSCFNPIRREIAKITLERLIADGRIHPARIEETAKRVETEFDQILQDGGEQAALEVGIADLHPELILLLGKLRYRSTNQQSVLKHCIETAQIAGVIAGEFSVNPKLAKRAGLLHDIGKAIDHEYEGPHDKVGASVCSKFGESAEVCEAVEHHHAESLTQVGLLAVIIHAANRLSGQRPGARKEVIESYINRLGDMEALVKTYDGVASAFVLQAGREVRAMVKPDLMSDQAASDLSQEIASRLRSELTLPGQVRVTVVRESKATEIAQ